MMNDVSQDIKAECGMAAFSSRLGIIEQHMTARSQAEMFAQIMSRMNEIDHGLEEIEDRHGDIIQKKSEATLYPYSEVDEKKDKQYLKDRIVTMEAHVHHLLSDPIVHKVEALAVEFGNSSETSENSTENKFVRFTENGEPCIFPVAYRGAVYNDCIELGGEPKCRTSNGVWSKCAINRDAEVREPIRVVKDEELAILETHIKHLKTMAEFLEDLEDGDDLDAGDFEFLLNGIRASHVAFEGSKLNSVLEEQRATYNGGANGKEQILQNLADEVKKVDETEKIIEKLKSFDDLNTFQHIEDARDLSARAQRKADIRRRRRSQFQKKFEKFVQRSETMRGKLGQLDDMPEHCLGSTAFKSTFSKISLGLVLLQFLFSFFTLSTVFEVSPPIVSLD